MTIPTPEQITAYLTARGWKSPAEAPTGRWTSPDGLAIPYRSEAMEDENDYYMLLRSIAVNEGRSTLAIGLAIDGHALPETPEADLAAIGAAIAVWRLAAEHPKSFRTLTQRLDIGLETVDSTERGQLLASLQGALETVRDLIGEAPSYIPALPERLPATDRRPRREVWAADPAARERIAPWPGPLHEQLLDGFVDAETEAVNALLDANLTATAEAVTEWRWDPHQAAATHYSGDLLPQDVPDADEALAEAREQVFASWGYAEGRIVSAWVDTQLKALAEQGWATSRSRSYDEADIRYQIHHDPGEAALVVYTPSFHLPDGQPHELEPAERSMYLRLTADLTKLTATGPAVQAFPAAAATNAEFEADKPSTVAAPVAAKEKGPIR